MADDMEQQLSALREQLEALQATNERLLREQSTHLLPDAARPSTSTGHQVPFEKIVFIPRERKCSKFYGNDESSSVTIEDWVEEVRACIYDRNCTITEKIQFVLDHLGGEARMEIKLRPRSERDVPEKIFKILTDMYSGRKSYVKLQQQFFGRKQREGETLCEYSHALMSLMELIVNTNSDCVPNPDRVVRDQFVEHVRSVSLRRELKKLVRQTPTISLWQVREEAMRWLEESEVEYGQTNSASVFRQFNMELSDCNAVTVDRDAELTEIKNILKQQQVQISALTQGFESFKVRFETSRCSPQVEAVNSQPVNQPAPVQRQCLRCNRPGHLARYCRTPMPNEFRPKRRHANQSEAEPSPAAAVESHVIESEHVSSVEPVPVMSNLVAPCPVMEVVMGGVPIPCLIDTGSMVSTITESCFSKNFESLGSQKLQSCHWLKLKAANGLDIPYIGYLELDVVVQGQIILNCGILVVKDPPCPTFSKQKERTPGLVGMNILTQCYQQLLCQHGVALPSILSELQDNNLWKEAMLTCQQLEDQSSSCVGKIRVQSKAPVPIPAGCLVLVPATGPKGKVNSRSLVYLEPTDSDETHLPPGVLLSHALLAMENGLTHVPVVNVGTQVAYLQPRALLGALYPADILDVSEVDFKERLTSEGWMVFIEQHSVDVESDWTSLDGINLTNLNLEQQTIVKKLLSKYKGVFSRGDGDLGCTSLIEHQIPLVDKAPVRQRYRRIPPS